MKRRFVGHDYTRRGIYMVTMAVEGRRQLLGRVCGSAGTTIYEGDVLFRQRLAGSGKGKVTCTVNYQTCDEHACLPPRDVELSFDLK